MAEPVARTEVAELFARNVAETRYENIPVETVEVTKRSILDTLGVAIGASGTVPGLSGLVELVKEAGGKEESTIWGFGGKVPAWMASFANGASAHGLDYDDVVDEPVVHPSATTVPAAFAIAERLGGVGGKDLITAVALGNDMIIRMRQSIVSSRGWFLVSVLGTFAATATSGKLLRLDADRLQDAFGIALCQAAGTMEIVHGTGSNIRAMYDSFVGKAGVLSALLAQKGVSGVKASLEGKAGLYNVYFNGEYRREALTDDLGKRFEGSRAGFKPWPCCRGSHPSVRATLELVRQHEVRPEEIERITVDVNSATLQARFTPLEARRRPTTPADAKYSFPYVLATAALKQRVAIEDFSLEAIQDTARLALAQKVSPRLNAELEAYTGISPVSVEVETKDGKVYSRWEQFAYGNPRNPMSDEDTFKKFVDCASYSAKTLPRGNAERLIELVGDLEKIEDIGEIVRLLP